MKTVQSTKAVPRRKFLGYCTATAALVAKSVSGWTAGGTEAIEQSLLELANKIEGDVLLPENKSFEPIREISWNRLLPERKPDVIVMAESQADVVATVKFASSHGIKICVRGGGHNWCAPALRDGGVLLDVSNLRSVSVDSATATANVGPGVRGLELIHHTKEHELAFPVAYCPSVPLSGFLLNGGNGWNFNRWGSACSNVLAVDVVLADGRVVTATSDEHADLFWAARGAGPGFFGVATSYRLKLHPIPRAITFSSYVFSGDKIDEATSFIDQLAGKLSRDILLAMVVGAPPPELAETMTTACTVVAFAYTDSPESGAAALDPLNKNIKVRSAAASTVNQPLDVDSLFAIMGGALPGGFRNIVDNVWSSTPLEKMLKDAPKHLASAPSARSHFFAACFHPEFELRDTAHSMSRRYIVYTYSVWEDEADDAINSAWHGKATEMFLEPYKEGRYVGETDLTHGTAVARECYTPEAWDRLRALRQKFDPGGRFYDYLGLA